MIFVVIGCILAISSVVALDLSQYPDSPAAPSLGGSNSNTENTNEQPTTDQNNPQGQTQESAVEAPETPQAPFVDYETAAQENQVAAQTELPNTNLQATAEQTEGTQSATASTTIGYGLALILFITNIITVFLLVKQKKPSESVQATQSIQTTQTTRTNPLKEYVQSARAAGTSDEDIKAACINSGWSEEDVLKAM